MINSGFNPLVEISRTTGRTMGELKEAMAQGQISIEMLEGAFASATAQGGKFHGMLERQGETLKGAINQLSGAITDMYNEIGKEGAGAIRGAIDAASFLVKNYKAVAEALGVVIGIVGAYRAALIAQTTWSKLAATATHAETFAKKTQIIVTNALTAATTRLNAAVALNPYAAAAAAVAALGYGIYKLVTYQTESEKAQEAFNESIKEGQAQITKERAEVEALFDSLKRAKEGTKEWDEARDAIQSKYGDILRNQSAEVANLTNIAEAQRIVTQEIERTARARAKEQAISTASETFAKRETEAKEKILDIIRNNNDKQLSEDEIQDLFKRSVRIMEGGIKASNEAGLWGGAFGKELEEKLGALDAQRLRSYIWDAETAKRELKKQMDDINAIFGTEAAETERQSEPAKPFEDLAKAVEQARGRVRTLKQELQDLRSGRAQSTNYATDIKAKEEELAAEQKRLALLTGVNPTSGGDGAEKDNERTRAQRAAAERKEAEEEKKRKAALARQIQELEISLIQDAEQKTLAALDARHERELETLARQRDELLERKRDNAEAAFYRDNANRERSFDRQAVTLSPEEEGVFVRTLELTTERHAQELKAIAQAEAQERNKYLAKWGEYHEKRAAVAEQYNRRIAKAASEWEQKGLERERTEALAKLDEEAAQTTESVARLFEDMSQKTAAQMRRIAAEGREALDYIAKGIYREDDNGKPLFGITKERLEVLNASASEMKKIGEAVDQLERKADSASSSIGKMAAAVRKLADAKSGTQAAAQAMDLMKEGAGELAGQISAARDAVDGLTTLMGDDLQDVSNHMGDVLTLGANVAQAFAAGGPLAGGIAAVVGLAQLAVKIIDAEHEYAIQALERQNEQLRDSYKELGRQIDETFGETKVRNLQKQTQNLESQIRNTRRQLSEEDAKKSSDDSKIKQYKDSIKNMEQQIRDNRRAAVDAIYGEEIKSAIQNFANAYANAWKGGENLTESLKAQARNMMRTMLLEHIKDLASPEVKNLRERIKAMFADKVFSEKEVKDIEQEVAAIQSQIDETINRGANGRILADLDTSGATPQASRGAFNAMSQETASELNGRFTAIQQSVTAISSVMEDMRTIGALSSAHLEDIAKSNRELYRIAARLDEIERNTRGLK